MSAIKKTRIQNVIATATVAVAAMFGCCSAQAAVYVGSWDPKFGPAFPNLGWEGDVTFTVADTCKNQISALAFNCSLQSISGHVNLYEWVQVGTVNTNILLTYTAADFPFGGTAHYTSTGTFTGFEAFLSWPELVNSFSEASITSPTYFSLFFDQWGPGLAYLKADWSGFGRNKIETDASGKNVVMSNFSVSEVPEPGTLALALAGLGGILAARRRKQRTKS